MCFYPKNYLRKYWCLAILYQLIASGSIYLESSTDTLKIQKIFVFKNFFKKIWKLEKCWMRELNQLRSTIHNFLKQQVTVLIVYAQKSHACNSSLGVNRENVSTLPEKLTRFMSSKCEILNKPSYPSILSCPVLSLPVSLSLSPATFSLSVLPPSIYVLSVCLSTFFSIR